MKALSKEFMDDLTKPAGLLYPVLERVKKDHTLMIAIRDNYINVYYRGGNILKLTEQSQGAYQSYFDTQYNKAAQPIPLVPSIISNQDDAQNWVDSFQSLKLVMDFYFAEQSKPEREFQQLVARENNDSTISNESEYFIADIECADTALNARFDMLAIRWLATQRKNGANCRATFIEMKYGDGALDGAAGLLKHLKDIDALITDKERYGQLLRTMEHKFNQLDQMGLLNFNRCKNDTKIKLDAEEKPEVVFILANHNPRSTKLNSILDDQKIDEYVQSNKFDLKFHMSSFSGYGLHSSCMLTLEKFRVLLTLLNNK